MGRVDSGALERIDLPDGEWVMVKKRISRGDEIAVKKAVVRHATVIPGSGGATVLDPTDLIEAGQYAGLEQAVKAWSFVYPATEWAEVDGAYVERPHPLAGQRVPVTNEELRNLEPETTDFIIAAINKLYGDPLTEDESKNSLEAGATAP